jgi:hypothetical protein
MMKKLGFITYMMCNCVAVSREGVDYHDYPGYIRVWNAQLQYETFRPELRDIPLTTDPVKQKLRGEIGDDQVAIVAFELFQQHDFPGYINFWFKNKLAMRDDNADKLRDLLVLLAPVINMDKTNESWVLKIVNEAGGARMACDYVPVFSQFCYEMFLCVTLDTSGEAIGKYNGKLSQGAEVLCEAIARNSEWELKEEELKFLGIVGFRESEGGWECIRDFKNQWCPSEESS